MNMIDVYLFHVYTQLRDLLESFIWFLYLFLTPDEDLGQNVVRTLNHRFVYVFIPFEIIWTLYIKIYRQSLLR